MDSQEEAVVAAEASTINLSNSMSQKRQTQKEMVVDAMTVTAEMIGTDARAVERAVNVTIEDLNIIIHLAVATESQSLL